MELESLALLTSVIGGVDIISVLEHITSMFESSSVRLTVASIDLRQKEKKLSHKLSLQGSPAPSSQHLFCLINLPLGLLKE